MLCLRLREFEYMRIIGLYGVVGWSVDDNWLHSAGASLWIDGKHYTTISEERLSSRIKYNGNYPEQSIQYCLEEINLTKNDVDIVGYVQSVHSPLRLQSIESILKREFPNAEIKFVDHHIAHASAAFLSSPFEVASILTFDGAGNSFPIVNQQGQVVASEYETGFFGKGNKKVEEPVMAIKHFRNGIHQKVEMNLGQIYNNLSRYIYTQIEPKKAASIDSQFIFMESAPGKIMGLAAYGDPSKVELSCLFKIECNGYFPTIVDHCIPSDKQLSNYAPEDIAAWLQEQFEDILVEYVENLAYYGLTEANLVLAGGCALNVLANRKILDSSVFDDVFVFPASNDAGLCFGAAINLAYKNESDIELPDNLASLGRSYSSEEIKEVLTSK